MEDVPKKGVLFCCHVSMFWTLVDLFCTKRLFSQETVFFPDYFTGHKNGRNSFSKEFICSCAINKFRTGTLCRILNYSAEHLKKPGNYRQLLLKERKEFSQEASKYLKGIPCYPRKICKSLPKHLILPSILPGCIEFVLQDHTPEHVNIQRKKMFSVKHLC